MMENTPLFSVLTEEQRSLIADRMVAETRRAGDLIFLQGRPATALYLIKSGWARLVTDQFAVLANLSAGSLLGDADVVLGRNYTISAEAASDLALWVLGAADLKMIFTENPAIARALKTALGVSDDQAIERHLRRLELMAGLSHAQLSDVVGHLRPEHFSAGQTIFQRGAEGDALYLVDEGRVNLSGPTGSLATVESGGSFGEGGFLTAETHDSDAIALTDVTAWSLNRSDFEELALRHPVLALNFSRVVSRHLRESTLRAATTVQVIQAPPPAPVPAQTAAVTGALVGLNRAADSTTSWWGRTSTGGKLRLIAVILLLIWLLGRGCPIPRHLAAFRQRRRQSTQAGSAVRLPRSDGAGGVGRRSADRCDADLHAVAHRDADADGDLHPDGHADRDADPDGDLYAGPADRNPGSAHRGARAGCRACGRARRRPPERPRR